THPAHDTALRDASARQPLHREPATSQSRHIERASATSAMTSTPDISLHRTKCREGSLPDSCTAKSGERESPSDISFHNRHRTLGLKSKAIFLNRFAHTGQGAGPCLLVFEPHSPRDLDSLCLRRAGTVQTFSQVADRVAADRQVFDQ